MARRTLPVAVALGLGFAVAGSPATAAEKTLEFQLVTRSLEPRTIEVPHVDGQSLTQSKAFGVAVFKDGRLATKEYVVTVDSGKAGVSSSGYSTYTFDDGSTLTLSFSAKAGANQPLHGEYKILSGTGAYQGATGKGTFDELETKIKNAGFYKVRLEVTIPSA